MVLIFGDSWGAGEWTGNDITHSGLAQYLLDDGIDTINLSTPGGSNSFTVDKLAAFLKTNTDILDKISQIFIFQTGWFRDHLSMSPYFKDITDDIIQNSKLINLSYIDKITARFYYTLCDLSKRYNKEFYLIGGLSDVSYYSNFEKDYPGIKVACPSLVNLVTGINDTRPVTFYTSNYYNLVNEIKSNLTTEELDTFLDWLDDSENRFNLCLTLPEYFTTQAGLHGTRNCYRILYDYILERKLLK
jgi:hypothetical protein